MRDVREVDANLVRAAGVREGADECGFDTVFLLDAPVGDSFASVIANGHAHADGAVAVDVGVDDAGEQARGLIDEREVFLLGRARGELGDECVVGLIGLCEHDHARGLAVEAMHDAGAGCAAGRGELAFGVME